MASALDSGQAALYGNPKADAKLERPDSHEKLDERSPKKLVGKVFCQNKSWTKRARARYILSKTLHVHVSMLGEQVSPCPLRLVTLFPAGRNVIVMKTEASLPSHHN